METQVPVKKIALPNQAVILIEENHSTPIVAFCAYFGGSVRREKENQCGITYLTQKLLPKGTENFSAEDLAFRIEALGNQINFITEKDAFGGHFSTISKYFDEAFKLFTEIFFHPIFPMEEVKKEKEFLFSEIQERRDRIYDYSLELCDKAIFSRHPYRFPTKGEIESIQSLKKEDLISWYYQWYQPNNLVFSVVGDLSMERAVEKIEKILNLLPQGKISKKDPPLELENGKREISVECDKHQLAISLGFLAPSATDKKRFPFEVVNGIFSGMGSRLFIELRDKKGLAYSVNSRYDPYLDHGTIKAYMGTAAEQEKKAKEGLWEELLKLREKPVRQEELERVKRYLIGLYEMRRQKNSSRALRYARYEFLGLGWKTANQYANEIESVTAETVRDLAKKYLQSDRYGCAVVRPVSAGTSRVSA